ncbi:MAG: type transporter, partial [Solirubrobacterales bacterium]|nr:type transporter [Solirubrobacterales bacterium]
VKDLQILRRSPLLLALLVAYAVVIGLPVGYGISAPPSKPKVAFYNGVPASQESFDLGGREVDASQYAEELFEDIDPIRVGSREEAIAKVRDGEALGALVVPEDITQQLQNATELPGVSEPPTLEVFYNADNPLKRRYVEQTVKARLADANLALSGEVTKVAASALDVLLAGGPFALPTGTIDVLGLKRAKTILEGAERGLPADDPQRAAIRQVVEFADVAITSLNFANPVLGAISAPIKVETTEVAGGNGSLEGFAVAAAATIALMFVAVLLGAGMLALEREEFAFGRLVRGLVRPIALLGEKVLLGALCAFVVGAGLLGILALFQPVPLDRAPQWLAALALGAVGFAALGVAVGALTRDVRAASLLAFLLSLPVAALALVPSGTVGDVAFDVIRVVSGAFPFKPTLDALDAGLNETGGLGLPLLHLVLLAAAYVALARVALRRFGAR